MLYNQSLQDITATNSKSQKQNDWYNIIDMIIKYQMQASLLILAETICIAILNFEINLLWPQNFLFLLSRKQLI